MQPQECPGTYRFNGLTIVTKGVAETLPFDEFRGIMQKIMYYVSQNNGADYLFVFKHTDGRKIFVIDNLNDEMKTNASDPAFVKDNNYFTVMFAEEY